jgi:hypothetical protein
MLCTLGIVTSMTYENPRCNYECEQQKRDNY